MKSGGAETESPSRLGRSQLGPAAAVLARAFSQDPLWCYYLPDAAEAGPKTMALMRYTLSYGLRYGEVQVTSERLEGVAVWQPSAKMHPSLGRALACGGLGLVWRLGTGVIAGFQEVERHVFEAHCRIAPFSHWYLAVVGVEPALQGRGLGSKLLRAMLDRLDAEASPAYLETEKERNVSFYERLGFRVTEHSVIPGSGIPVWCMLRKSEL